MKKSAYQLVNRGRKGRPCWTIEQNGVYRTSSSRKSDMDGLLSLCRRDERAALIKSGAAA